MGGGVFWSCFTDPFLSQSPREFYRFHFLEQLLVCTYTICQHAQLLISGRISSGSSSLLSRTLFCIPFAPVYCFQLTVSSHHPHLLFWRQLLSSLLLIFWKFFTPAFGDGFSLEFEWQHSRTLLSILVGLNKTAV